MKECTCPPDHSVTKLGHCRTCESLRGYTLGSFRVVESSAIKAEAETPPSAALFICGRRTHVDGTTHDFAWATYADDDSTHGVCRCGLGQLDGLHVASHAP